MKLSDYVAKFLADQGIRHVFAISGGASLHLIDSVKKSPNIDFICPQHEQAGAMAADGYARVTRNLGAAISTSGPGATNMLTGVCCAYYDSVPVIYITGQVASFRLSGDSGVRQTGFQETAVVDIFKPVTKYAAILTDVSRIRYELEKACYLAKSGRPGPVLIDIPDDLQREEINPDELESFAIPAKQQSDHKELDRIVENCLELVSKASRPIVILGWGVYLANAEDEATYFVEKLNLPVAPTWALLHAFPADHPLLVGPIGTHGTRYGNYAVQNADLLITIGSRNDTRVAGGLEDFGREAKKIIVDIDKHELKKFEKYGRDYALLVEADALDFLRIANQKLDKIKAPQVATWQAKINQWKQDYPICPPEYYQEIDTNPYVFVKTLSERISEKDVVILDTGCALAWSMQAFDFKIGQALFHDFNNTAMGYALPASIGASFALGGEKVYCLTGDGSLQMNIQELATVLRHNLPIKIFLFNNHGYSMIQQTQDQWLNSDYAASTIDGGLAFPDFVSVAEAYGFHTVNIKRNEEIAAKVEEVISHEGPVFCNVEINPSHRVIPQVKFGRPIEDGEPLLSREEFKKNMIVKPHPASANE